MAGRQQNAILDHIRTLSARSDASACDAELLRQFVSHRDEAAFEALLRRHGPMVLRFARRVLGSESDAEDVFQATFLLLARRAAVIRKRESVASWLHGVAHRLALSARGKRARRQERERQAAEARQIEAPESAWSELEEALHEVLAQLPAKYRTPLIHCYLEGSTQEEVARQLGKPLGTVRSWLARGRELLRKRLLRRGISLSVEGAGAALLASACATAEAVPPLLRTSTLQAAHRFAVGGNVMTSLSPSVAALVRKGLTALLAAKIKSGAAWVLLVALLAAGSGWAAHRTFGARTPEPEEIARKIPPKRAASEERSRVDASGDPLPPGAIARLGYMRLRHRGGVSFFSIAYSPDGKLLASGGPDGLVRLWDPSTGKEIRRIYAHQSGVFCVCFSGNSKLLASCGNDGIPGSSARVWDVGTGKRLFHTGPHNPHLQTVALSPDGKVLAAGGSRSIVYLWDVESGKTLHQIAGKLLDGAAGSSIETLAFAPDGATLFSATHYEAIIRRWAVAKGEELPPLTGHKKETWGIALAIDARGRSLACAGSDGVCRIWDLSSGKERNQFGGGKAKIAYPTFAPDGKTLAGTVGNQIHIWDTATGKELHQFQTETQLVGLTYSPDGSTLAGRDRDVIYLVDSQTGKQRFAHEGHKGFIGQVAFSADGSKVLTSGTDKTVRVWEARTGRELHRHTGDEAVFSPDGKMAASMAKVLKGVRLWDPVSGKDLRSLSGGANFTRDISENCTFSADGKYVAAWGGMKEPIRIWETATGEERRPIPINWLLARLALSPDGQHVAAAEYALNKPSFVWAIDSGRQNKVFPGRLSATNGLAFSPDSTILAVAGTSPCIQLWDVRTGEARGQLDVSRKYVGQVTFAPDGKSLAVVGWPGASIYLWEIATGKIRRCFDGQANGARIVAFSPDGKLLATGGSDGTTLVWDVMDVTQSRQGQQAKLTTEALADCWAALGSEDAEKAWQAMRTLVAASEQTVSLLNQHLSVQAIDAAKVARWIAELNDDSFAVRERASRELAAVGRPIVPALRKAQANAPSAEVARRVKDLLDKLDNPGLSAAELAALRAVEVLEHLGAAEARQFLAKLAKGSADARLTREAKASLHRLEKRTNKP